MSCLYGSLFNVATDIRVASPTFGKYITKILTSKNQKSMYILKGFAHGYLTLKPNTFMQWCVDADFYANAVRCVRWDTVGIEWPGNMEEYVISERNRKDQLLKVK